MKNTSDELKNSIFPTKVYFRLPWRSYQKRVLDELEKYLKDKSLHVIAAPGSGKTVLGLEVIRRLNKPALILAPTLAIRNQWIDRFLRLFAPELTCQPEWISTDVRRPQILTVVTYQALHSMVVGNLETETESELNEDNTTLKNNRKTQKKTKKLRKNQKKDIQSPNLSDIIALYHEKNVGVVVLDEAHHLRSEWWKSLHKFLSKLKNIQLVSLTATPPYDAPHNEFRRYVELCGPADAVISVPELVLEGNLCPHQDYVHFSVPTDDESRKIKQIRRKIRNFTNQLLVRNDFIEMVEDHPWIKDPEQNIEKILDDPAHFSSLLIFLKAAKRTVSPELTDILGTNVKKIPELTLEWLEILLEGVIYRHFSYVSDYKDLIDKIKGELYEIGVIERRNIKLRAPKEIVSLLTTSMMKLNSILEITHHEYRSLGANLRLVILTDFIRKNEMPRSATNLPPIRRIGVVPIFEKLRREGDKDLKLGVLCGTLIIIPKSAKTALEKKLQGLNQATGNVTIKPLPYDATFFEVIPSGTYKRHIVQIMTDLFTEGEITVLIGTKSLLGEGWDAPAINTLILASFVGTFMLSNQMRGRAIRTFAKDPKKTANIWHLVCVEENAQNPGTDYETIVRRFKTFVGVSFNEPIIRSGIDRLDIGDPPFNRKRVVQINKRMFKKALNRKEMRKSWFEALHIEKKEPKELVEEITAPKGFLPQNRRLVFYKTIEALLWQSLFLFLYISLNLLRAIIRTWRYKEFRPTSLEAALFLLALPFLIGALVALPKTIKALILLVKHGSLTSSMKQLALIVLDSLIYCEAIKTDYKKFTVEVEKNRGVVYCHLKGGTYYEKFIFLDALEELLNPIENPRYIIIRKTTLFGKYRRTDYHAVPKLIAAKKAYATYFYHQWKKRVGSALLVYTRTKEGRKILLRARESSLAASFQEKSERISRWK